MSDKEKVEYEERIKLKEKNLVKYNNYYNLISICRLLDFFLLIANFYYGYKYNFNILVITLIMIELMIFILLTKIHEKVNNKKIIEKNSIRLNRDDILRLSDGWRIFKDNGEEFLDTNHPFINDLNIFGKGSFFQWINITQTVWGRKKLRAILCSNNNNLTKIDIVERQEALKELAKDLDLREKLYSALIKNKKRKFNEEEFLSYCESTEYKILNGPINIIRIVAPILTIIALGLTIMGEINFFYFLLLFMVNLAVLKLATKEVSKGIEVFENIKFVMAGYLNALEFIQSSNFKSKDLNKIKGNLDGGIEALKKIYNISGWFYDRKNIFYIILNGLLYWDFQILYRSEKWKQTYGKSINGYFESFGEFEALESLSILGREMDGFNLPEIIDDFEISGDNISHPMIRGKAVSNNFLLNNNKRVALITGSNMSGKSTFLRTIGFNAFIAYLGLPVRASKMSLPIMNIYSCMRTGDNLDENISSFYAEILRVKLIVDATKRGEHVLFLLDEIFKGTNSIDRHEGARVLINQLLLGQTVGLVSTHDLELCSLEEEKKEVVNYNFMEFYKDNKLNFDYILRKGISQTRNAKYLMKMAGIEI